MLKNTLLFALVLFATMNVAAQKTYQLASPDGKVTVNITTKGSLAYDINVDGKQVLAPSALSMALSTNEVWGSDVKVKKARRSTINETVPSLVYRQTQMTNHCNVLTLQCAGNYDVEFRAYDNGVAYRFVSHVAKPFEVMREGVEYNLTDDCVCVAPYVDGFKENNPEAQFKTSFENVYTTSPVSQLDSRRYCFLPLVVEAAPGVKLCLTESHLENYPGLFLQASSGNALKGINAPYPKEMKQGGHNNLQMLVQTRENYIAKVSAPRSFPWRVAMISRNDAELAENNLSYLLAAPNRIGDTSWIRPGKVAWDWWCNWNIGGVDFEAGVNTATYKHFIDFAAEHGIEYVILDEGWAVNLKADLMQVVPEIDLKGIVDYAAAKNVGIILWAGYKAFDRDMENVCRHYAAMGVKGFKVDFMDRDDQIITDFYFRAAETCARYHLLVDFHGAFKPAGMNRTFPNAINFEGVYGLEQLKWIPASHDRMTYDCQIPFIRQTAGPMDYTQGAMINTVKGAYTPNYSSPMSQGTRCHQLGLYMVLESPLSMLCDSPTNYRLLGGKCTDFIAKVPTTWDETRVLAGEIGKYVVTARRKGNTWYVGGITNWDARDVKVDTSVLGSGSWTMESFTDGVNAHRRADDYRHTTGKSIPAGETIDVHMAPGGGFALVLTAK
ncbi:MAG: glycoside hydrolase family 97 protein [Muribaculaceae bacterium]